MKHAREIKVGILATVCVFLLFFGLNFLKGVNIFSPTNAYHGIYYNLHGLHKRDALDLYEIVQGRASPDATGKPVPFAVGDFEAVMLTGTVGAAAEVYQLLRLIGFEVGV